MPREIVIRINTDALEKASASVKALVEKAREAYDSVRGTGKRSGARSAGGPPNDEARVSRGDSLTEAPSGVAEARARGGFFDDGVRVLAHGLRRVGAAARQVSEGDLSGLGSIAFQGAKALAAAVAGPVGVLGVEAAKLGTEALEAFVQRQVDERVSVLEAELAALDERLHYAERLRDDPRFAAAESADAATQAEREDPTFRGQIREEASGEKLHLRDGEFTWPGR